MAQFQAAVALRHSCLKGSALGLTGTLASPSLQTSLLSWIFSHLLSFPSLLPSTRDELLSVNPVSFSLSMHPDQVVNPLPSLPFSIDGRYPLEDHLPFLSCSMALNGSSGRPRISGGFLRLIGLCLHEKEMHHPSTFPLPYSHLPSLPKGLSPSLLVEKYHSRVFPHESPTSGYSMGNAPSGKERFRGKEKGDHRVSVNLAHPPSSPLGK